MSNTQSVNNLEQGTAKLPPIMSIVEPCEHYGSPIHPVMILLPSAMSLQNNHQYLMPAMHHKSD